MTDKSIKTERRRKHMANLVAPHGGKGIVRVIFEKGLPGQAITTKVQIA